MWLCCGTVCEGGDWEGTMLLAWLLAVFQSLPPLPTSKLGPSGADSWVDGFVYVPGPCESPWTLLWSWEFLLPPQLPQVFSVRCFEALFPCSGTLGCSPVCLAPQLSLSVYPHSHVEPPSSLAATSPAPVLSARLPISVPPTGLDEYFFFNSLVVGLPYSSIFRQFWLFFVLHW